MRYPSLCAILEPPTAANGARRARKQYTPAECDRIPVITTRGRTLTVRAVTPGDMALLVDLLARLSDHTSQLRFFRPTASGELIWREAARVANGDWRLRTALIASAEEQGEERAVAVAELAHDLGAPTVAEVAVVVRDDYQHEGVGKMIAEVLVQVAMLRGVKTLRANMLAENQAARKLVRGLGLPYTAEMRRGEITMLLNLPRS